MTKNKLPGIVTILILTLITAIVWISMGVYRTFTTKPEPVVAAAISKPITPTLDANAIKSIIAAVFLAPTEIPDLVTSGSPAPTTVPTIAPVATPIPSVSPTPEATASASPGVTI